VGCAPPLRGRENHPARDRRMTNDMKGSKRTDSWPFGKSESAVWLAGVIVTVVIGDAFGFVYGFIVIVAVGLVGLMVAQRSKRRAR
jgi:hypothetical protein